jgi:hypothetical protein
MEKGKLFEVKSTKDERCDFKNFVEKWMHSFLILARQTLND